MNHLKILVFFTYFVSFQNYFILTYIKIIEFIFFQENSFINVTLNLILSQGFVNVLL